MTPEVRASILLVEDNPVHAELIRHSFETSRGDLELCLAVTMAEAIAFLDTSRVAVVLCDYLLPDGNGLDILRYHLSREKLAVPFVMLTGHGDEQLAVESMKLGATDYIVKSEVSFSLLPDVCRAIIRGHEQRLEKVRAEEELREGEESLKFVLEGSMLGLWDWNIETDVVKRNHIWAEMLGYTQAEIEAMPGHWLEFIHSDDRNRVWQSIQDNLDGVLAIHELKYRIRTKEGSYKWILDRARIVKRDQDGKPLRMSGTHTDISEGKLIEDTQLFLAECGWSEKEDFFEALAKYLAESLEMDFVCIDQLLGERSIARTLAVYHDGRFEDNIEYALKDTPCGDVVGKKICYFPNSVRHMFPHDLVLQEMQAESYVGTTLWSSEGHPLGLIAVIGRRRLKQTSTAEKILQLVALRAAGELERRASEEQKALLAERLRESQKIEAVGILAGGMAHDFNNIMAAVIGYISLARIGAKPGSAVYNNLINAEECSENAVKLGHHLLTFADGNGGVMQRFQIVPLIKSALEQGVEGSAIALEFDVAADIPPVLGDMFQLNQVFTNLAQNAKDAMTTGGKLRVSVSVGTGYECGDPTLAPGKYVQITLQDSGPGIPAEALPKVFDPYFTTKEMSSRKGVGLGLAICRAIIRKHDGAITVASHPGDGATFHVWLPLKTE